jgi:hypothetical protein
MKNIFFKKLFCFYILKRRCQARYEEPIIYNLVSNFVFLFENLSSKVNYNLIPRMANTYGILAAANNAYRTLDYIQISRGKVAALENPFL